MKAGSHPTISKSYNKTVNGQKVMMEHLELKMVVTNLRMRMESLRCQKSKSPEVSYRMSIWREKNIVKTVDNVSDVT